VGNEIGPAYDPSARDDAGTSPAPPGRKKSTGALMCALCGVLGGDGDWTDAAARPGVFTRNVDPLQRRRERMNRVACARKVLAFYGLTLSDWQASSFILSTLTGKSEIVDSLTHLWAAAEKLIGRPCDPLDPRLLERLEAASG
jgi:hypothetical protein